MNDNQIYVLYMVVTDQATYHVNSPLTFYKSIPTISQLNVEIKQAIGNWLTFHDAESQGILDTLECPNSTYEICGFLFFLQVETLK